MATHSKAVVFLHKFRTYPSIVPFITRHNFPSLIRLFLFVFLNFLWGWNRIRFSTDFKLYGWLTIANGGLALLLAARTNLLTEILQIPPPILLLYHRWSGRATFVHATIHMSLTLQLWIKTKQIEVTLTEGRNQIGIMMWIVLCLIFITSVSIIRRRMFETFYYVHFLFIVFVGGALYHANPGGPEFLLPGFVLWVVDRGIRLWHNFKTINIQSITYYTGDVLKLRFQGVKPHRPGQMAWIQIPTISYFNWHPFTMASGPDDESTVIAIRGLGHYTKKVQLLSSSATSACDNVSSENVDAIYTEETPRIKLAVDGPYGLDRIQYDRHSVIAIVAGGIGITPGISITSHIMHHAKLAKVSGSSRHLHILWVIKNRQHVTWFDKELTEMLSIASDARLRVSINLDIYITGTHLAEDAVDKDMDNMGTIQKYDGPETAHYGRPNILQWFQHIKTARTGHDVAVNVCGPRQLMQDVRNAAAATSSTDGLFLVHEEQFEL